MGSSPRKRCHSRGSGNIDYQYLTIALCLFLNCGQNVISVDPAPTATIQKGNTELLEDSDTPLHRAILEQADLDYINVLLQSIDVNQPDNQAEIALHLAVKQGNLELVEILLAHQADVHAKDLKGETPLHLAAFTGQSKVIQALLVNQAAIEMKNNQGCTPLHLAALEVQPQAIQILLENQADIETKNNKGRTPLHLAAYDRNPAVIQLLLDHKASIEAKDNQGQTPLHRAAVKEQVKAVQLLVNQQANIAAIDHNGKIPYELAELEKVKQLLATQQTGVITAPQRTSLDTLIFHGDYKNIGTRILSYLTTRDKGKLRRTCTEMGWKLFERDALHLILRPDRLQDMRLHNYSRLYPHAQHATGITFEPIPIDALVQNTRDLKTILKDTRFIPKNVVFKGGLENLKAVCDLLPPTVENIEIATGIPSGKRIDLSSYEHLKAIKVRDNPASIVLPKGAIVLHASSYGEPGATNKEVQPAIFPTDPKNKVFDSFIGVKKIPAGAITIGWRIGEGTFGKVYRGSWGECPVALKKIGDDQREQSAEELSWEIGRLSTLCHPNVAQFYGIYQEGKEDCTYLVLEVCEGGDLKKTLETKGAAIPWSKRWQWALEMSEGLAYLHSQGTVHRDLKPHNVLLDGNGKAKLADLGVAQVDKLLEDKQTGSYARTQEFSAPENVNDAILSTKATDIYALGIVLWQIATHGGIPRIMRKIENFLPEREPIPANCPQSFKELMLDCWQLDPDKRPSAAELARRLEALGAELNTGQHVLIKACQKVENVIHPRRKEGRSYIAPFVTNHRLEESIETYWTRIEAAQAKGEKPGDLPLELKEIFNEFIKSPDSNTLLLLGEAGLGKTLTTYQWGDQLLEQWWTHINTGTPAPAYFPIFIRPEVRTWSHSRIKDAFQKVARKYNLPPGIAPLVFIDGYDELQLDEAPTPIVEHVGLQETGGFKLIVTCRPNTVEKSALGTRFGFNGALTTRHFLPFSLDQLLTYLHKELSWEEQVYEDYKKSLANAEAVRTVLRNPFVLQLFKQSWETLSKRPLDQLNRWQIYEGFMAHILETKQPLLSKEVQEYLQGSYPDLLSSYRAFISKVAWRAFENKSLTLGRQKALGFSRWPYVKKYAKKDAKQEFVKRQAQLEAEVEKAPEEKKAQLSRRSLLNKADYVSLTKKRVNQFRAELPLKPRGKKEEKHYEYSHKSFFEYGVAKRLLLLQNSLDIVEEGIALLNSRKIQEETEVLQFWQEGWKEPGSQALIEPLFDLITRSRDNEAIQQASANSATLLAQAGIVFSGRSLQGVRLAGADLSRTILSHTSLAGAQLPGALLRETYVGNADFRNANLSGVNFGQYPSLKCEKAVLCLSYNSAGTQLAVGLGDGNIELYNQAEGAYTPLATLQGHISRVWSVTYRPDGQQLASGSEDYTVGLWDVHRQQLITQLKGHTGRVWSVTYRPDGQQLASGSDDNTVGLWDVHRQQLITQLKGHTGRVNSVTYRPDGQQLASGSNDTTVRLWDVHCQQLITQLKEHTGSVMSITYRPDGQQLASGSDDNTVGLWDVHRQQLITQLKGHTGKILSVTYRPDGQQLASGSDDNTVGLWDPSSLQLQTMLKGHSRGVSSVCYRPDGKQLASGSDDKTVGLWDLFSLQLQTMLKGHSNEVLSVCYRPDGKQLASGSSDNTVGLWDPSSLQLQTMLKGHSGWVMSVCYRPDGKQLASGSDDNTVGLWDPSSLQLQTMLKGHSNEVLSVCYRPDGKQLASGSSDNTVGLWDPSSLQLQTMLKGHSRGVLSVCYRPDGKQLASGSEDQAIFVWAKQDIPGLGQETWQLIHRFENSHSLAAPGALLKGATLSPNNRALLKQKGANDIEDPQELEREKISSPIKTHKEDPTVLNQKGNPKQHKKGQEPLGEGDKGKCSVM